MNFVTAAWASNHMIHENSPGIGAPIQALVLVCPGIGAVNTGSNSNTFRTFLRHGSYALWFFSIPVVHSRHSESFSGEGTLLPLWRFSSEKAKKKQATVLGMGW